MEELTRLDNIFIMVMVWYGSNKGLTEFIRVGTMAIKDDYIKVRVSKEQKEFFKRIAKGKKISMSEFIVVATEERALKEQDKLENKESLEFRVSELEKKLQDIKLKMESQRVKKKSIFKNFFDIIKK